jgi:hypothetical protein
MSNQVFRRLMPLATLLCLLLSRSATAAEPKVVVPAAEPKVVVTARTVGNPVVMAIAHDAQGLSLDRAAALAIQELMVGTEWTLLDNGQLLIAKNGKTLLGWFAVPEADGIFWIHVRREKSQVDGEIFINDDKKNGSSQLFWTIWSEDGRRSVTANVYTRLNYAP